GPGVTAVTPQGGETTVGESNRGALPDGPRVVRADVRRRGQGRRRVRATGPVRSCQSSETEPPAARIFSRAEPERASTATSSLTVISPVPSTLTRWPLRTAPFATRASTVTWPPSGYSAASLSRVTTWYSVRNAFLN